MKEKAFEYIDAIAAKLGVAAEHVYGILVKQAIADGWATIAMIIVFITIFLTAFIYSSKKTEWGDVAITLSWVISLISGIGLLLTIIIGGIEGATAIKQLINPEYYAIKEILDVLGGGK